MTRGLATLALLPWFACSACGSSGTSGTGGAGGSNFGGAGAISGAGGKSSGGVGAGAGTGGAAGGGGTASGGTSSGGTASGGSSSGGTGSGGTASGGTSSGGAGSGGTATGGTAGANCPAQVPSTVKPGSPFAFIRPIASGYLDALIDSVREVPGGFAEALFDVEHCGVLNATESITVDGRVAYTTNGDASSVGTLDSARRIGTQGAGVMVFDPSTYEVSLYASQSLALAPVFTKMVNTTEPSAVKQGGFIAALWNGTSASPYTWGPISMTAQDKNGYVVKATSTGAVEWAHQIQNGSASVLTVDDFGASTLRVSRSGASTNVAPVTMNGKELIPLGTDTLKCTLAQVSPAGAITWVKRLPACSDANIRWALSPTSQSLHVLSKANVDWGQGAFSTSNLEHVLTKFDAAGKIAWQKSVVTLTNNVTTYGYPWLIVADNDVPVIHGYLESTHTFGGKTISNQPGTDGIFFEAFEPTGAPRWLSGFTDCGEAGSAHFSPFSRVHGKVALGVLVSGCKANGVPIATLVNGFYASTSNLVVIDP